MQISNDISTKEHEYEDGYSLQINKVQDVMMDMNEDDFSISDNFDIKIANNNEATMSSRSSAQSEGDYQAIFEENV